MFTKKLHHDVLKYISTFFDSRKVNFQMVFRFNNNNGDNDNVNSNNDNSGVYFNHFQFVILTLSLNVLAVY